MKKLSSLIVFLMVLVLAISGCSFCQPTPKEDLVITPGQAHTLGSSANLTVTVDLKGNEFGSITGNSITASDYSFVDNTITIYSSYLNTFYEGEYTFTLNAGEKHVNFEIELVDLSPIMSIDNDKKVYSEGSLVVNVNTKGQQIVSLCVGDSVIPSDKYSYVDSKVTIAAEYMQGLSARDSYTLKLTTGEGEATATFTVNDVPTIADKTNFIKLPGESVVNEDFRQLVTNVVGTLTVSYTKVEGDGTLQDNGNGTFNYTPATNHSGQAIIKVTATDNYGATASREIKLTYKTVNPTLGESFVFNKSSVNNLVIDINLKGSEHNDFDVNFVELTGGEITADDYSFANGKITINKEYLQSLAIGEYTFTAKTTAGQATFTVAVADIPTAQVIGENNVVNEGNSIAYALDLKTSVFQGVKFDGEMLPEAAYSLEGSTLTINATAIEDLPYGNNTLSIVTDICEIEITLRKNDDPVIADKTDFIKLPGESVTNESFVGLVTNEVGSTLTLTYSLKQGSKGTLTDNNDNTFNYVPEDILSGDVYIVVNVTDKYGATASREIKLTYKTVNPTLDSSYEFNTSDTNDLEINVNLKGNQHGSFSVEFVEISGNGIAQGDYTLDNANGKVTISKEYLQGLGNGTYDFVVKTTAGQATFQVVVVELPVITLTSDSNVVGDTGELEYSVDLKGNTFTAVKVGKTTLEDTAYTFESNTLQLGDQAIALMSYGNNTLTLVTDGGNATFTVIKNDVPTIDDKSDYVKLPGESISKDSFASLVHNSVGNVTYAYSLSAGDGEFTDHEDGTFSFAPSGVYAGTASIVFTATDEYGLTASKTITLTYKTVNPVIYDATGKKVVDKKNEFGDVVMTVDTFGSESSSLYYEMVDITLDGDTIGSANYVLKTNNDGRYFSVKASYLLTLAPQLYTFTLHTTVGSAEFTIEVKDTRKVAVDVDSYELVKTVTLGDLVINVTPYNNVVTADSITIADVQMTVETDFTFSNNVITVFNSFLNTLEQGDYELQINGETKVDICIKDPTAPRVASSSKTNAVEKATVNADVDISVQFFGLEDETKLYRKGSEVDSQYYEIQTDTVVLKADYLKTLSYGEKTFTLTNSNGQDTFVVNIGDKPASTSSNQNVTKFTHETISNESLRVAAASPWELASFNLVSVVYYNYAESATGDSVTGTVTADTHTFSGDFGSIVISDSNKNFNVSRTNGWFGTIVFTYTATDNLGFVSDEISMDIVFKQHTPSIDAANSKVYDKLDGADSSANIVYTITNASGNSDFPVCKIMNGDVELINGEDYSIGNKSGSYRYFTINASYLSTLTGDSATLTLYTNGGRSNFTVSIVESLGTSVATATFDKNDAQDVTFTLTGSPLAISSIKHDNSDFTDYSFDSGVLTIDKEYLATLEYGERVFVVNNGYKNLQLTVSVTDTRLPSLTSDQVEYTKGTAGASITLTMYDKTFVKLQYNQEDVDSANYSFNNGTLTINGGYIDELNEDSVAFTIVTSGNSLTVTVSVATDVNLPEISLTSSNYQIDMFNDVTFAVSLNGNTFSGITYADNSLTSGTDYAYDDTNNVLTIKASKLNSIYRFGTTEYSFVLTTIEGNDVSFKVNTDHAENRVLNGGFETGNLYGWNSYAIWKNESGMKAWTDDRVVSGGYFDQGYSYNKDGNYNLGIYGGSISKDSGQERMGHLRSANFTLGGSGWISFKLGGGKLAEFEYVSVRKASDNIEVARFANRHFKNTTLSGTDNAEAYMFQYYYDLSDYIDEELYFVITDATSNNWCVLSADSFFTYYETAPTTNADNLAENILFTVQNIDTAENQIKAGNSFSGDTFSDNWTISGTGWGLDGNAVKSNKSNGDKGTGILRSSAFSIDGDLKYMRMDWAGGLKNDKTIFVSIKEVGTNIEVLRYVRRSNLSSKEGDSYDNHMFDLSGLDTNKLYYVEFSDNATGGWGVSYVKSVRLVNKAKWDEKDAGDRAEAISGIVTDYTYKLPYSI